MIMIACINSGISGIGWHWISKIDLSPINLELGMHSIFKIFKCIGVIENGYFGVQKEILEAARSDTAVH